MDYEYRSLIDYLYNVLKLYKTVLNYKNYMNIGFSSYFKAVLSNFLRC